MMPKGVSAISWNMLVSFGLVRSGIGTQKEAAFCLALESSRAASIVGYSWSQSPEALRFEDTRVMYVTWLAVWFHLNWSRKYIKLSLAVSKPPQGATFAVVIFNPIGGGHIQARPGSVEDWANAKRTMSARTIVKTEKIAMVQDPKQKRYDSEWKACEISQWDRVSRIQIMVDN
jgi:hypothetical protein